MKIKFEYLILGLITTILIFLTLGLWYSSSVSFPLLTVPFILLAIFAYCILIMRFQLAILWLVLLIFYFFPYSSIAPSIRAEENYFTIYLRIFGLFNAWDLLILFSITAVLFHKFKQGILSLTSLPNVAFLGILACYLVAFFVGLFHIHGNLLSYGKADILLPFVSLQPIIYMVAMYFITVMVIQSKNELAFTIDFVKWLSIALLIYGIIRAGLIFTGRIETMWPFGLPIVLYDQLMLLYVPVFWGLISFLSKEKANNISLFWVLLAVFFIIISARRFNYLLLVFGIFFTLFFFKKVYSVYINSILKKMLPPTKIMLGLILLIIIAVPGTLQKIGYTFQTINFYKTADQSAGSDIRHAEIKNLFANMNERPYTYFCGFGLGTTWQPIEYQPYDSFSFTKTTLIRTKGWIPQFHLPYISLLFRYGIVGCLIYWSICGFFIFHYYRKIKMLRHFLQSPSLCLAGLIFILLILPSIGDSVNPTAPILVGFLIGFIERSIAQVEYHGEIKNA